jgi:hypothetical protein
MADSPLLPVLKAFLDYDRKHTPSKEKSLAANIALPRAVFGNGLAKDVGWFEQHSTHPTKLLFRAAPAWKSALVPWDKTDYKIKAAAPIAQLDRATDF